MPSKLQGADLKDTRKKERILEVLQSFHLYLKAKRGFNLLDIIQPLPHSPKAF